VHVLLTQVEFLYEQYQNAVSTQLDSDYHQMMGDKAIADNNMLKISLTKSVRACPFNLLRKTW
jgi:hypothetical protein